MIADNSVKCVQLVEMDQTANENFDLESQTTSTTIRQGTFSQDKQQLSKDIADNHSTTNVLSAQDKKQSGGMSFAVKPQNSGFQPFQDSIIEDFPPQVDEQNNSQPQQVQGDQNGSTTEQQEEDTPLMIKAKRDFMKKVFSIILFQLLVTSVMCGASMYVKEFLDFQIDMYGFFFVALAVIVTTQIIVCTSRNVARRVPLNYIVLFIFTLSWAYLISFFCSGVSINQDGTRNERGATIIFLSVIVTLVVVLALAFFAWASSINFTFGGSFCSVFGSALAAISMLIIIGFPFVYIVYSLLSGVTFGIYLIFDLQTIMDGKYNDIKLDDYILASMLVYTDIIMLFIRIVEILSRILPRD